MKRLILNEKMNIEHEDEYWIKILILNEKINIDWKDKYWLKR